MLQKRLDNVSMWRAIACLMVFVVHFGQRIGIDGVARKFTDFGAYGVQLFFIISGFLIVKSYYDYGKEHPWKFYAKKAIALLPLYYLVILYYFVVHTFVLKDVPKDPTGYGWFRYIFLLNGIVPDTGTYFWDNLGITWTIPYFIIAYATIPLLLKLIKGWKGSVVLFFATLGLTYLRYKGYFQGWCYFVNHFPSFIIGVVVYYAIANEKTEWVLFGFTALSIVLFILKLWISITYSLLFGVMFLATKNISFQSNFAKRLLRVGDKYSYTMYLAHGILFIHILDRFVLNRMLEIAIAVFGTILLTFMIKNFIETPIQKGLNALLKKTERKTIDEFNPRNREKLR